MTAINLIIISRYENTDFLNTVQGYNLENSGTVTVINQPTNGLDEVTQVRAALNASMTNLIIYDWSVTLEADPSAQVQSIIGSVTADLVYLGKFLDTCSKYAIQSNISNFNIVSGTEPVGFNAILMTPSFTGSLISFLDANVNKYYSLAYILLEMNISNPYTSYAVSPNLFVYNPMYNSIDTSNSYSVKTTECEPITTEIVPPSDNSLMIFWIILIVVGVCLIVFVLLNYTSFGVNTKKFATPVDYQ